MGEPALAFDREKSPDGFLHVENSHVTKACVNPYKGDTIPQWRALRLDPGRDYQMWRSPDELKRALPSAKRLPLLSEHVEVTAKDFPEEMIDGCMGSDPVWNDPYIDNSLTVWRQRGVDGVEDRYKTQLSCGYRYRADMTPGTIDGVAFDGIMRDIDFQHVALVGAGRAGPEVTVGDSMEMGRMATRQAILEKVLKGKLPDGATVDPKAILMALDAAEEEAMDAEEKEREEQEAEDKKARDAKKARDKKAMDAKRARDAEEEDKTAEEKRAEDRKARDAKAKDEGESEEDCEKRHKAEDAEWKEACDKRARDRKGHDADEPKDKPEGVDAKAMDAAITTATTMLTKRFKDLREAENACRPYVGDLNTMAFDSAADVYRHTFKTMKTPVGADVDPSAFPTILKLIPLPGSKREPIAMDAADNDDFFKRNPDAARIGFA